jgi:hypothetical protein
MLDLIDDKEPRKAEDLRAFFRTWIHYDAFTGRLTRIKGNGTQNGTSPRPLTVTKKLSGRTKTIGYHISICCRSYSVNNVIWCYVTGHYPHNEIVYFKNGDKEDRRFNNLELMSKSRHAHLVQIRSDLGATENVFGSTGYIPRIIVRGKRVNLGRFDDAREARIAYMSAKLKLRQTPERLNV